MSYDHVTHMFASHRSRLAGWTIIAAMLWLPSFADASTSWKVVSGNWGVSTNWTSGEPTNTVDALIQNGGTATVSMSGEVCQDLRIGDSSGTNGAVSMTDGSLSYYHLWLGNGGTGTFTQSGGSHSASTQFMAGVGTTGSGTYNFNGGTLTTNLMQIGFAGSGTFNHTLGSNTATTLIVGNSTTSTGLYSLSGTGTLSAGSETVGQYGAGTFTQSGGTNTITSISGLTLGNYSGSSGTYNLNAGTLELKGLKKGAGTATFNLGAGRLLANGDFSSSLPINLTSTAPWGIDTVGYSVTLSGEISGTGYLYKRGVGTLTLAGTNTYTGLTIVDNGTLAITGSVTSSRIDSAYATITQSGTSNVAAQKLYLGTFGTATYNLNGGSLSASTEEIFGFYHGNGVVNQNNGSNSTGSLSLAVDPTGTATYTLNNGSVSAGSEVVAQSGTATFTQTGGTNTITSAAGLVLAQNAGSNGTYNFSGGTLELSSLSKGAGTAAFNFGGASLWASDDFTTTLPMNLTGANGNAQVNTQGHNVEFWGVLSGNGGLNKNGDGMLTITSANAYHGTTIINRGTLNVTGSLDPVSLVTVTANGILAGTGSVGAVTVEAGGGIAPGLVGTIGTLTMGDLTLAADSSLLFDLASPLNSDKISMAGSTLSIDDLDLSDSTFTDVGTGLIAGTYVLIDAGSIIGSLGVNLTGTLDGLVATLSLSASGDDLILKLSQSGGAVPEPASMLIWGAGSLLALAFARRRRNRAIC